MKVIGKIFLSTMSYAAGVVIAGILSSLLHIPSLKPIPGVVSEQTLFLQMLLATPLLAGTIMLLEAGLGGTWTQRWLSIAALMYITLGLNTFIELRIFSDLLQGNVVLSSLPTFLPCLLAAAVVAYRPKQQRALDNTADSSHRQFTAGGWAWRVAIAWLAFPIIYLVFGMCVGPFVVEHYNGTIAGLRVPPLNVILSTQLVRSPLFLAASLPVLWLWRKSRRGFIVAMGLAHAMTVGIYQLVQASFLPPILRILHSVEITADSFAYATVLGLLFIRAATTTRVPESRELVMGSTH